MNIALPTVDTTTPPGKVGMVGLGVMGAGIAGCLLRKGFALHVHNRSAAKLAPLLALGAQAGGLAELGRQSRVVVLSLPDTAAVEAVLFGADGLAATLAPGSCIIDTSTIAAAATRQFAQRLAAAGITLLDAPVSGGQQGAEQGTLVCMVGGERAAFDACAPVFAAFAARAVHLGGPGAGQVSKACNQVAVTGAMLGVAEALALARREGVDPAAVREVLMGGSARSFSLDKHGQRIVDQAFEPGFRAVLMRKDLRLALDNGAARAAYMPVATLAEKLLDALCEDGRGELDWSVLGALFSERGGA